MTDAVTNNYSITQPTVGADLNTWGGVLNNGSLAPIDAALGANLGIAVTATDVTMTTSQFQNAIFLVTGALTGDKNLIVPLSPNSATVACGGRFVVVNNTTVAHNLTVKTAASGSTGVVVPQGFTALLYSDGTNVGYCSNGLPAFALASNGNPNTVLAGTAATATTNASIAFDYVNGTLYVCTTTGDAADAVWANIVANALASGLPTPELEGYLTPTSNTPIITGDVVGATVIYYTPLTGTWAAVHNGIKIVPYQFSQLPLTLTSSQAASNIYDVFLAYNSGVPVIGTGPSWISGSGGSITAGSCARGTGVGGAAINRDAATGLWVNAASTSLIYNTGSGNNTITVAAGQGVYLGSLYIDATPGQITCHRSVGQSRKWGIYNPYNSQPITLQLADPTSSWAQGAGIAQSNGNANNYTQSFLGLAQSSVRTEFSQLMVTTDSEVSIGIGLNATNAFSGTLGSVFPSNVRIGATVIARYLALPAVGLNQFNSLETGSSVSLGAVFYGTSTNMLLQTSWLG